jgi:predicted dehydrogenase
VLLSYGEDADSGQRLQLVTGQHSLVRPVAGDGRARVGLIGAGTFARSTLLPAIQRVPGVELIGLCSATGTTGRRAAEKFAFRYCTTDETDILGDPQVNTVVIATRHHLHARQVVAALQAGKHVFCEKPLCLTEEELAWIIRAYRDIEPALRPCLMVGFNRRFAPMAVRMKSFLDGVNAPLAMHYRVNAGFVPPDHWVHDPEQGGGRILGELCHFVDLMIFLTGSPVVEVQARALANPAHAGDDNVIAYLQFANGSHGTIGYLASGDNSYSKERLEVFGGGRAAVLEDFRCLDLVRDGYKQTFRSRFRQDKGHRDEWKSFVQGIATGCVAVPFDHIVGSTLTTLRIADSRRSEQPLGVDAGAFLAAFPALRQAD